MIERLLTAGALAAGITFGVAPASAFGCQWVPPALDEAATSADHIFLATVAEVPAPQTYVIHVDRVFRGAPPAELTFRPNPEDLKTTCLVLDVGERYVIGTDRLEGPLYIGQVWYHVDGDAAGGVYLLNWPGTADELFAVLARLPDTSLVQDRGPVRLEPIGWMLVAVALAMAARRVRAGSPVG